jgi:hypothetical protein
VLINRILNNAKFNNKLDGNYHIVRSTISDINLVFKQSSTKYKNIKEKPIVSYLSSDNYYKDSKPTISKQDNKKPQSNNKLCWKNVKNVINVQINYNDKGCQLNGLEERLINLTNQPPKKGPIKRFLSSILGNKTNKEGCIEAFESETIQNNRSISATPKSSDLNYPKPITSPQAQIE